MTEAKEAPRCGDHARDFRLTCDRAAGHVRSDDPADWHEAASAQEVKQYTQGWTLDTAHTERARWAPDPWEIPRGESKTEPEGD